MLIAMAWDQLLIAATEIIAHTITYVDAHVIVSVLVDSQVFLLANLELKELFLHLTIVKFLFPLPGELQLFCFLLIGPDLVRLLVL